MAKGQKRGNREAKKPKQAKAKPAAVGTFITTGRVGPAPTGGAKRK